MRREVDELFFKDGSYSEGKFVYGEIIGNGFQYWALTGNTYSSQFVFGKLHGYKVLQYKDGGKYEGEFYRMREAILDLNWLIYQSLMEIEPESGTDTLYGVGNASSSQHGGKKPSGRISAEKAENMTVSQEKMEDSRSHMTSKEYKLQKDQRLMKNSEIRRGRYVLKVHEVTMPPFLGQTFPPAFKLLNFSRENQKPRTKILSKSPASKKDQSPEPGLLSKAH